MYYLLSVLAYLQQQYHDLILFRRFCILVTCRAVAAEICEELFTPDAPHIELALSGVEVFMNASGSHHQLRKLDLRLDVIKSSTIICGGVYMYSNHQGCDGGRLYFGILFLPSLTIIHYFGCACVCTPNCNQENNFWKA